MSLLPFLAVAFGAGALALLARRVPWSAVTVGIGGLLLGAVAAAGIEPDAPLRLAGTSLAGTEFARTFLLLGCVSGALLALLGLATSRPGDVAAATLLGLGGAAVALGTADPIVALLAATAGGFAGVIVTAGMRTPRGAVSAAWHLRGLGVAGALALAAAAWMARPVEAIAAEPVAFGLALLAVAVAVAIRLGAVPFHLPAARLPDAGPDVALPLVLAWGPAAFAVVALTWSDATVATLGLALEVERSLIVVAGAVTLLVATGAAYLHDDLEHVVTYATIADAGVVLLAFGALDPAAWEPARTWLLAFVVSKTAFAGWALTVRAAFGTRRLRELGGWAVRAPLLALALLAIAAASVGWPGLAAFDARWALIRLAVPGPLAAIVMLGALATAGLYLRILAVGVRRRSPTVAAGASQRPVLPARLAGRGAVGLARAVPLAWAPNRTPIAAALVVALSLLTIGVAAGGFGAREAAAGLPPQPAATPLPSTSPSPEPSATPGPTRRPTPRPTAAPSGSPSSSPSAPGSPAPSPSGGVPSAGVPSPSFVPVP